MSNYCDKGHWEVGMPLPCKQCRIEELGRDLLNLVCRIHRDGGHYIAKYGEAKAIADADIVAAQNNADLDTLQADNAELVAALSRLTQCAPATVECENMHHRKLDQHGYDKTCHLVSRYAEALCNAQELLTKVRKP